MEPNIARILLGNKNENGKNNGKVVHPQFGQFDPPKMVDLFPGPALLVDSAMNVKYSNVFATSLLEHIHEEDALLRSLISRCLSNECPDIQKATLEGDKGQRHYDLFAFPLKQTNKNTVPLVFLFGRDMTVEHNLTNALVESRQMFKDLASCSTDFAWETDGHGSFIYVSPKGILGFTAFELNGKNSNEIIIGAEDYNPFATKDKITDTELWLKRSDGSMACLLISGVPVFDNRGQWQGARGVCRDITHIREREAALRRVRKREAVLNKIVATIRDMVTASDMLERAIQATLEGIEADFCCIIEKKKTANGSFKAEVKQQQGALSDPDIIYSLCQKALETWQNSDADSYKTEAFQTNNQKILMGITSHHNMDNGAIFLIRKGEQVWKDDETALFSGITSHLGIAIEQMITQKELERRAFTDELTSLLNRRAFGEAVQKRIKNQLRSRKSGALLYLDLDNFKNINDSKGHVYGDRVLCELARKLENDVRVGDYLARLGGDEFAVWLDEVSETEALIKAQRFVVQINELANMADVTGPQLSASIGISVSDPDNIQTLDELMDKADKALYQAKATGKASCRIYGHGEDSEIVQNSDPSAASKGNDHA